jgi:hypothetical protein
MGKGAATKHLSRRNPTKDPIMAKTIQNKSMNDLELRLGAAGLEYENDGVVHLFSWPEVLRRLGSADCDLALNLDWGAGYRIDSIDWMEMMTYESDVGEMSHPTLLGGKIAGKSTCVVEFEDELIRLYYEGAGDDEAGILTLQHAKTSRLAIHGATFRAFGAKTEIEARSFWFSGSVAY